MKKLFIWPRWQCWRLIYLFGGYDMRVITLEKTRYTVRDDRTDIMAAHVKCTGKHKRVKSKGAEKRFFPVHWNGDSTADYVAAYERLNEAKHLLPWDWDQLRAEPCFLPVGEDSYEVET